MPTSRELLFDTYKKAYAQRQAIADHVTLTLTPDSIDTFDADTARVELGKLMSYLYGGLDLDEVPVDFAIMHAEKFKNQPVWYDILRSFLTAVVAEKKEFAESYHKDAQDAEDVLSQALNALS